MRIFRVDMDVLHKVHICLIRFYGRFKEIASGLLCKKTQKTPKSDLELAKRRLKDIR